MAEAVDGPLTCDASGMVMMHRVFRHHFAAAPGLVRGVRTGDAPHATAVASQLELLSRMLHAHHEAEDARLWSTLNERAPACSLHVQRMQQQHLAILSPLTELDAALPAWSVSADDPSAVLAAIDGVNAALAVHLPDEEAVIVPVIERTMTQSELGWYSEHGRRATPKGRTWDALGLIMDAQPDGGAQFLSTELPPPVRLLWHLVGRRRYARTVASLQPASDRGP